MAPLSFVQNPGLRMILMIAIIFNLVLGSITLYRQMSFADAMATSQINVVEKVGSVDKHVSNVAKDVTTIKNDVGNMKTDVHRELESAVHDIQANGQTLLDQMKDLMAKADQATAAANSATKAAKATHAKVSQKIITGPEADALKRAAKKKTTVIKVWPWQ